MEGEWDLAGGEKVVAKVDASGTESVYLDAHLVSRSSRGLKPNGHEVRRHGADDGAYRGQKDIRVFFENGGCRLVVDGVTMSPATLSVDAPAPDLLGGGEQPFGARDKLAIAIAGIGIAGMLAFGWSYRTKSPGDRPAVALAAGRLPNTQTLKTANGLLTVHYPSNFHAKDRPLGAGSSVLWLEANEGYEKLSFFSWGRPSTLDVWKLDQVWHAGTVESWGADGTRYVGEEQRSEGKCHGEYAAIVVRHLILSGGDHVRHWSCVFVHDSHAFRFSTFTEESKAPDEAYLKSLVDAAEL